MSTEFEPFTCECGGKVVLRAAQGRTRCYAAGVNLPVPDDFLLPTCDKCGENYYDADISEELDKRMRSAAAAWVKERHPDIAVLVDDIHDRVQGLDRALGSLAAFSKVKFTPVERDQILTIMRSISGM